MLVLTMKEIKLQIRSYQYALQGFLLGVLPVVLISSAAENPLLPGRWGEFAGTLITALLLGGIGMVFRAPAIGRDLIAAGVILENFLICYELPSDPLLTLGVLLLSFGTFYYLFTARLYPASVLTGTLQLERFQGAAWGLWVITMLAPLFAAYADIYSIAVFASLMLMLWQMAVFLRLKRYFRQKKLVLAGLLLLVILFAVLSKKLDAILPGLFAAMALER